MKIESLVKFLSKESSLEIYPDGPESAALFFRGRKILSISRVRTKSACSLGVNAMLSPRIMIPPSAVGITDKACDSFRSRGDFPSKDCDMMGSDSRPSTERLICLIQPSKERSEKGRFKKQTRSSFPEISECSDKGSRDQQIQSMSAGKADKSSGESSRSTSQSSPCPPGTARIPKRSSSISKRR